MSWVQELYGMIGKTVYEEYSGKIYAHEVEGFRVGTTGIYLELKDSGLINIHRAYVLSGGSLANLATELQLPDARNTENKEEHMARKKITEQALQNWDEVNESLKLIGDAQNEITVIEAEMNEQILKLKAGAKERIKPYEADIKVHEMMVQQYTAAHREDLKGKSLKLAFGTVGFRLSTRLVLPKKLEQVIENLKKNGMMDCLNIKTSVNKDALKTYEEEDILRVGGMLEKEDTFWYEVTRDTVQD